MDTAYRKIIGKIPVAALLGDGADDKKTQQRIYNYLDLCNEQIYLRATGRIDDARWQCWRDGIEVHLSKPAFNAVWQKVVAYDKNKGIGKPTFSSLRRLACSGYKDDPKHWKKSPPRRFQCNPAESRHE